ncbi:MAG: hypothetical protein JW762_01950 [Dehalococcoidales bacterium]|nr:hypothetical protein [Dehalococcoidales bacterium]
MRKMKHLHPVYWSSLILIFSQAIALFVACQVEKFIIENEVVIPEVSLGIPLVYFLGAVVSLGLVLFLIPVSKLKIVFRILFSLLFLWGLFVDLSFFLPVVVSAFLGVGAIIVWLIRPRIWLHNLLLIFSLAAMGAVFGSMLSSWTAVLLMVILSVYDILAVRFGYMMWIAKKLSQLDTLPAFIIPKAGKGWNMDLRDIELMDGESSERDYSLLGGGDIGFPLILIVTVFFTYGIASSLILAAFTLIGLGSVYAIQKVFLKGKPMAALPPMTFADLIGFLIVYFV